MKDELAAWTPIDDLPANYSDLADSDLQSLARVWEDQRQELTGTRALSEFNERLQRAWAIETGVIEHLYTLDRGITELLVERGIDAALIPHSATDHDPSLVASIILDQKEAIEMIFDFTNRRRPLSVSYIKELHALLTRHQPTFRAVDPLGQQRDVELRRGDYRNLPARPSRNHGGDEREYCPPEHVSSEMDRLIDMHLVQELEVPTEVQAAWLHHRFTEIHPFQDGNGRVARAIASLVFIRAGLFPLVVTRDERETYIDALETADRGELGPLADLFSTIQRRSLVKALSIADTVIQQEQVDQVIAAIGDVLEKRQLNLRKQWDKAKELAHDLRSVARRRLDDVAEKLRMQVSSADFHFRVDEEQWGDDRDHYHRWQIIEAAQRLDYFANTNAYRAWVRLVLRGDAQNELLLSFHGLGHEFRGLVTVSACLFRRGEGEEEGIRVTDFQVLNDEIFQINYLEEYAQVEERFERWLNKCLVKGLETWRRSIGS